MRRLVLAFAVAAALVPLTSLPARAGGDETRLTCFPLAPADIRYDDTWGAGRSGGRHHQGTDIMAPKHTVVMAVADGVVETLDSGSTAGYYVRLVHEGGWETWYMHLDNDRAGTDDGSGGADTAWAEGLAVGDRVVAGQIIGYVGDSGNAEWTGSHLHFEVHPDGAATDPYPFLVEADERIAALRLAAAGPILDEEAFDRTRFAAYEPADPNEVMFDTSETFDEISEADVPDRGDLACLEPVLDPTAVAGDPATPAHAVGLTVAD